MKFERTPDTKAYTIRYRGKPRSITKIEIRMENKRIAAQWKATPKEDADARAILLQAWLDLNSGWLYTWQFSFSTQETRIDATHEFIARLPHALDAYTPDLGELSTYLRFYKQHAAHAAVEASHAMRGRRGYISSIASCKKRIRELLALDTPPERRADRDEKIAALEAKIARIAPPQTHAFDSSATPDGRPLTETLAAPDSEESDASPEPWIWETAERILTAQQYRLIRLHYLEGLDMAAAARSMGVSKERTRQIRLEAVAKIRKTLQTEDAPAHA